MRRMAEYFFKMPNIPDKYIDRSIMETSCPRLQRFLISPKNKKLQVYTILLNIIILYDIIYAISL
jgi:hypothetical protein